MKRVVTLLTVTLLLSPNTIDAETIKENIIDKEIETKDILLNEQADTIQKEIKTHEINKENLLKENESNSLITPMSSPVLNLSQTSGGYAKSHSITVTQTNWTNMQFVFTTTSSFPSASSNWENMSQDKTLYTPEATGTYYLHLKGTHNGKEQRYTSGAFRVDNTLPSVSISRSTSSWTTSVNLTANASDSHSGINRLVLKQGSDKNLLSVYEIGFWSGRNRTLSNRKFTFSSDEKYRGGIFIPANKFKHNVEYVLSFKMRKVSGDIRYIGGHNHIASVQDVFIDGKRPSAVESGTNRWNGAVYYPNDTNTHTVEIRFKTDVYNNANDKSVHIQPNRSKYDEGRSYTVEIWDVQLEHGKQATSYEANSVDVGTSKNPYDLTVTSNGTYTFIAVDKAGNFRESSITINNIDRTAPTVSLSKNGGGWASSHSTTINASDSGGSGLKTLQYRWTTSNTFPTSGWSNTSSGATISSPQTTGEHYLHIKATDNAGNVSQFTSKVFQVDRTAPVITLTPDITEKTHKNITIAIDVEDDGSGVKHVKYIGRNEVKNSDFSNGDQYWDIQVGNIEITQGKMILKGDGLDRAYQSNVFSGDREGATYYAEVVARGKGTLNVRYGRTTGEPTEDYSQYLTDDENFKVYKFRLERDERSDNNLLVEKTDNGYIEIKSVKVYAEGEVTGNTFEVTENGTYTFEVEDHAGNITRRSITVNNIDKSLSLVQPVIESFGETEIAETRQILKANIEPILIRDWRENENSWRLYAQAEPLQTTDGTFTLPSGTLKIKGISEIKQRKGNGTLPNVKLNSKTILDDNKVTIVEATNSRGEFELVFPDNALEITLDPTVKAGEYKSIITWELVSAP